MRSAANAMASVGLCALAIGVGAACISATGSSGNAPGPTLLTINPSSFGRGVTCGTLPGGWRMYVATLTDVTDPVRNVRLASSMPVRCSLPVSFAFVIPGHWYTVQIEGYDRDDIIPYGPPSSGSPHMVDPGTGLDVAPRWKTTCGTQGSVPDAGSSDAGADADASGGTMHGPSLAQPNVDVTVQDCAPLTEILSKRDSGVSIDLAELRGSLTCGSGDGQIERIRVLPQQSVLPARDAACDELVTYTPVAADTEYRFRVEASQKGSSTVQWATSCQAVAKSDVIVPVVCGGLTSLGAIRVDIASLLAKAGRSCAEGDIVSYQAVLTDTPASSTYRSCTLDTLFSPLVGGTYQMVVSAFDGAGQVQLDAYCQAVVIPGATAVAVCDVLP